MTEILLIRVTKVLELSEKALLVKEFRNIKTPIPKSAYYGQEGDNHWFAKLVVENNFKSDYTILKEKVV